MNTESKEILFGAATMLVLVAALAALSTGRSVAAGQTGAYPVTATFNRVDGLLEGDVVRLGGIRVGKVEKAELDANYRARLTFRIDGGVTLPTDTSAAIHTDGLFGSKFVALLPGGDDAIIKPGGAISFTQDALIVTELLDLIIAEGRAAMKVRNQAPPETRK